MKVNFYATLRAVVGAKTVELELNRRATVEELIYEIVKRYPALHEHLIDRQGKLHGHIHVFVNGRDVYYLEDDYKTLLNPEDKVDIFPPVGGGWRRMRSQPTL
ncbi:MAG: MoaD/ThiS family protein [Anaerolineales bacterium]|nr:MoaD/ThiS family protein [Anaerolineales bacterium]MDW8162956.1 ubiquitin-like small modifier protein 1 [Anaerolineales bacterium]